MAHLNKYNISYYHGSPQNHIRLLQPHLDERTRKYGIFISNNPILPMLFSLLTDKSKAVVEYKTERDRFISGSVITPHINAYGYLYRVRPFQDIEYIQPLEYVIRSHERVIECIKITLDQVRSIGWTIDMI